MANYDKTVLVGRLGSDPKLKTLDSGDNVCNMSVAVTRGWGDKEKTVWFGVAVWGKRAEPCSKYLRKGSPVLVEGSVDVSTYTKDGETKASLKLSASRVEFLESKKDAEAAGRFAVEGAPVAAAPVQEDVPF